VSHGRDLKVFNYFLAYAKLICYMTTTLLAAMQNGECGGEIFAIVLEVKVFIVHCELLMRFQLRQASQFSGVSSTNPQITESIIFKKPFNAIS
jgi:hypothetical protein